MSGAALTLAAALFGVFPFDLEAAAWVAGFHHPAFTAAMEVVSWFGNGWIPLVLVGAAAAACALRRKWIEAAFVVATLTAVPIADGLKILVGRPRPPACSLNFSDLFPFLDRYSYPSGHVLFYVVFFGFVAYLSWRYFTGVLRWVSVSVCVALVVLIGPSRIFLGEHWVSDAIGSYLIGGFWLLSLILLYQAALSRMQAAENPRRVS